MAKTDTPATVQAVEQATKLAQAVNAAEQAMATADTLLNELGTLRFRMREAGLHTDGVEAHYSATEDAVITAQKWTRAAKHAAGMAQFSQVTDLEREAHGNEGS